MPVDDYRRACARREQLRSLHRAFKGQVDGFITLAHIGAGQRGQPKVGTPRYNDASSAIGAPTLSLPVLAVESCRSACRSWDLSTKTPSSSAMARWIIGRQRHSWSERNAP